MLCKNVLLKTLTSKLAMPHEAAGVAEIVYVTGAPFVPLIVDSDGIAVIEHPDTVVKS